MESTGQAKAEAQSRAEASKIEGEASVQQAKLKSEATRIEAVSFIHKLSTSVHQSSGMPFTAQYCPLSVS